MGHALLWIMFLSSLLTFGCRPIQIDKSITFNGMPETDISIGELKCRNEFLFYQDDKAALLKNKRTAEMVLWELSDCRILFFLYDQDGTGRGAFKASFEIDGNERQEVHLKRVWVEIEVSNASVSE